MGKKERKFRAERKFERASKRTLATRARRRSGTSHGAKYVDRSLPQLNFIRKYIRANPIDLGENLGEGRAIIKIPKVFSLLEGPDEVLSVLKAITHCSRGNIDEIFLDYTSCEDFDLGAGILLGAVAKTIREEWNARRVKRTFLGTFPKNSRAAELLRIVGIIKQLDIKEHLATPEAQSKFETYELTLGFAASQYSGRASNQESAASGLVSYFEKCFARLDLHLNVDAKGRILELSGEVLDNAERHSSQNRWWIQAYFESKSSPSEPEGICHVSILSFGLTMAQSLQQGEMRSDVRSRLDELLKKNIYEGGWLSFRKDITEENLLTLYALQDGVSSTSKAGAGSGTMKLIKHFQEMADPIDKDSRMVVFSGSTQIVFDQDKYKMTANSAAREVLAFNDTNDLDLPPDSKNVRGIEGYLPGTIISLKFSLKKAYLQAIKEKNPCQS